MYWAGTYLSLFSSSNPFMLVDISVIGCCFDLLSLHQSCSIIEFIAIFDLYLALQSLLTSVLTYLVKK